MSGKKAAFYAILLSILSACAVEARAGVTISDRRYWPSEARSSAGTVIIEGNPSAYAYVVPHWTWRAKARRAR
jgi:hypothetical protein